MAMYCTLTVGILVCINCHNINVCLFVPTGQGMVEMWSSIPYNASLVDAVDMVVSPRHEKHVKVSGGPLRKF